MSKSEWIYVFWAIWVAVNSATYFYVRKDWEIVTPFKDKVTWLCAVTHNTIIMLLIAVWKERNK